MARSGLGEWLLVCLVCVPAVGCYTYTYTAVTPQPGTYVALDLNDLGRLQLSERVGPGVRTIEGDLSQLPDSQYVVLVHKTIDIRGLETKWSLEPVELNRSYVGVVRERHLSSGRTVAFVGSVALAAGYFIASRGIFGAGGDPANTNPPQPPSGQ